MIISRTAFKYLPKYSSSLLLSQFGLIYRDYATLLKVQQLPTALSINSQSIAAVFSARGVEPSLLDSHVKV